MSTMSIGLSMFGANASQETQTKLDGFGTLLYTLVMGLIAWRVAVGGIDIKANQETSMLMALPLWIPYMSVSYTHLTLPTICSV